MTRCLPVLLLLALASAPAAGARLDDSLSPRQRVDTTSTWLYEGAGDWTEDQLNALVAEVRGMELRFRTAAYVGKDVEIYLSIPRHVSGVRVPSTMRVEWKTRGLFSAGTVLPGDRALVYRGKITQPVTTEIFDFRIYLDARTSERGIQFDPVFDIEPLQP